MGQYNWVKMDGRTGEMGRSHWVKLNGLNFVDGAKYNPIGVAKEVFIKVYNIIQEEVLVRRIYKIQIDPFNVPFQ